MENFLEKYPTVTGHYEWESSTKRVKRRFFLPYCTACGLDGGEYLFNREYGIIFRRSADSRSEVSFHGGHASPLGKKLDASSYDSFSRSLKALRFMSRKDRRLMSVRANGDDYSLIIPRETPRIWFYGDSTPKSKELWDHLLRIVKTFCQGGDVKLFDKINGCYGYFVGGRRWRRRGLIVSEIMP